MSVPVVQLYRVVRHIIGHKLRGEKRYPLVLMLEPLFECNLACAGCGKTAYSREILARRLTAEECLAAVDECGAPVVSIGGGEPLLHHELHKIVHGIIKRKRFVYLCTNGLLLKKHIAEYTPSPYLTFSIHLDGCRKHHDAATGRKGVFDRAVAGVTLARRQGFRVTINCTLFERVTALETVEFFDFVTQLGVEGITIAPGFHYERASHHDVFLKKKASKQLFRHILALGKGRGWKLNHTALYLDFLAGNQTYQCTPWGSPTRNIFGWQKPCYLLVNEGYASTFKELIETTDWDKYGTGRNPKCQHCMLHCGFEPTAVNDSLSHPLKALKVFLMGPGTDGPMAPDPEQSSVQTDPVLVETTVNKAGR